LILADRLGVADPAFEPDERRIAAPEQPIGTDLIDIGLGEQARNILIRPTIAL
jgi:hypothetical protein